MINSKKKGAAGEREFANYCKNMGFDTRRTAQYNGKELDIINVYDNYIGIKLNKGNNDIRITFIPSLLKISIILTTIFILVTFIIIKFNLYFFI